MKVAQTSSSPPTSIPTATRTPPSSPGVKDRISQLFEFSGKTAVNSAPTLPSMPLTNDGYQAPPGTNDGFQAPPGTRRDIHRPILGTKKRTTVLFGTSITDAVIGKRLARKGRQVINISESGADIKMISEMVDDFALYDPAADDIEKVVLFFGTNDIKDSSKGVSHLKTPVFNLINKVKYCFPGAIILVMSNLPMKNMYWYTCPNFIYFNDILRDASHKTNSYYVDCFRNFLSEDGFDYNKFLFRDPWHLNKRGLGILCSILKTVINYDTFSSVFRMDYY
jgi:hypothetical protein